MKNHSKNQSGVGTIEALLLVVLVSIVGFVGWYVYNSNKKLNNIYDNTALSTTPAVKKAADAPPTTVPNDSQATEIKEVIVTSPSDWKKTTYDNYVSYVGQDKENNIEVTLSAGTDPSITLSCNQPLNDSETLTFAKPLANQPKTSYLTTTSIFAENNSVCSMMLTGTYQAKVGTVSDTQGAEFKSKLPVYRVSAYTSNLDSTTTYPTKDAFTKSPLYQQLLDTFKSVQLK